LRGEVDVDDAEALGVAEGPFEIVEERPDEVAADVDSRRDRVGNGGDVIAQVLHAQRILDDAVDGARWIVERGAVLGDVNRDRAVAFAEPEQQPGERRGMYFPARLGVRRLRLAHFTRAG